MINLDIGLICAYDKNKLIGNNNSLPWKIKEEIMFFKKITTDNIVIMGYNTFCSLPKALPNRINIIISSKSNSNNEKNVYFFNKIEDSLDFCKRLGLNKKILVIGGRSIYEYFINNNLINYMYLSEINQTFEGNIYFPEFNESNWIKSVFLKEELFTVYYYKKI